MNYDLKLISEMCAELGFENVNETDNSVEISLFDEGILVFQNLQDENDSLIGFLNTPWHNHGNIMFSGKDGNYTEMDYLDILEGLKKGTVLICEILLENELKDRYLVHRDYFDELMFIQAGEEIRLRRIA